MLSSIWKIVSTRIVEIALVVGVAILVLGGYNCGQKSRDDEIARIATQLATSQKTVEIKDGLFAVQTHEIGNLKSVIESLRDDLELSGDSYAERIGDLLDQIEKAKQRVLSLEGLVIKWKKAYEGAVAASQTEEPPKEPGDPGRTRVDFSKDFGAIGVTGHTLTNPPEGYVRVEQLRPWRLTIAVVKNSDGTWTSYVASSEDNMGVEISMSGIDLSVTKPQWYKRLWVDASVDAFGELGGRLGLSYRNDRWSVGAGCTFSQGGFGCGPSIGYRLFK